METIANIYQSQFGHAPAAHAFAPGRINLIGEHIDYNDGKVLPIALPIGISVAIGPSSKAGISCYSTLLNEVTHRRFDETATEHWTDYCLAAWTAIKGDSAIGLNICVDSSLPHGASVSSSAAILVALLRAFREMNGLDLSDVEIAKRAQWAENEFVGVQCGLMDQMASSVAAPMQALSFDTMSGETKPVYMINGSSILTIHSGQTRKLQGNAYNDRRAACDRAKSQMGLDSLRHATVADLDEISDRDDRTKVGFVIAEYARVEQMIAALAENNLIKVGQLLYACHQGLSADYEVSTPMMDAMVNFCKSASAIGARMTGAGFGGCIIVLCRTKDAKSLNSEILAKFPEAYTINQMDF